LQNYQEMQLPSNQGMPAQNNQSMPNIQIPGPKNSNTSGPSLNPAPLPLPLSSNFKVDELKGSDRLSTSSSTGPSLMRVSNIEPTNLSLDALDVKAPQAKVVAEYPIKKPVDVRSIPVPPQDEPVIPAQIHIAPETPLLVK
jgi:hypothetical protein